MKRTGNSDVIQQKAKIFRPWSLELQTFSEVLDLSAGRVPSGKDVPFLEENTTIRISVLHNQTKSIIWNLFALFLQKKPTVLCRFKNNKLTYWFFLSSVLRMNQVKQELNFHDKDTQFFRFRNSECGLNHITSERDAEDELQEGLSLLSQLGPDALLTMILRKW